MESTPAYRDNDYTLFLEDGAPYLSAGGRRYMLS